MIRPRTPAGRSAYTRSTARFPLPCPKNSGALLHLIDFRSGFRHPKSVLCNIHHITPGHANQRYGQANVPIRFDRLFLFRPILHKPLLYKFLVIIVHLPQIRSGFGFAHRIRHVKYIPDGSALVPGGYGNPPGSFADAPAKTIPKVKACAGRCVRALCIYEDGVPKIILI